MAEPSDHFDGRRFFNPGVDTDRSLWQVFRWLAARQRTPWPVPPPDDPIDAARLAGLTAAGGIAVTYIGQATFLIQIDGVNILTDPIFSERASPVRWAGPRRVRPPALPLAGLPPIHLVLLSHNHYDHLDLPSLRAIAERWAPPIITGLGNGRYLGSRGIPGAIECDWWQTLEAAGLKVTFVPAQHWSKRFSQPRRASLWGGHLVEGRSGRVYFAGDTGYPGQFGEIRRRLGAPDLALLPIGAYEPRWFMGPQHMNPEDAVKAHGDLAARFSIAMHFATFPLTDEAIDAPAVALEAARRDHGVSEARFRLPVFGHPLVWRPEDPDRLAG